MTHPGAKVKSRSRSRVKEEARDGDDILEQRGKKFTMRDIVVDHKIFRYIFIPSYFDYLMTRDDPFWLRDSSIIEPMQKLWNAVFPYEPLMILLDCPVKFVVRRYF